MQTRNDSLLFVLVLGAGVAFCPAALGQPKESGKKVVPDKAIIKPVRMTRKDLGWTPVRVKGQTEIIRGSLTDSDDRLVDGSRYDSFTIHLGRSDTLRATLRSAEFDAVLALFLGDERVAIDDDGAGGTDARLTYTAERSGLYELVFNAIDEESRGSYRAEYEIIPGSANRIEPTSASPSGLVIGGPAFEGRLTSDDPRTPDGSHYTLVEFSGDSSDLVTIRLRSTDFDTWLAVGSSSKDGFVVLGYNDDSPSGIGSEVALMLPRSGQFTCMVTTFEPGQTGRFELRIARRDATEPARPPEAGWHALYERRNVSGDAFAVLVGVDDYPRIPVKDNPNGNDLGSCVADARLMRQLLIERFGYKPENIVLIEDHYATRDHIIAALQSFLGRVGSDARVVFYFSGHGGQVPDTHLTGPADPEPDGQDETICVWPGTEASVDVILDDELSILLGRLRARQVIAILDTCHSGTGTRGPSKYLDLQSLHGPFRTRTEFVDRGTPTKRSKVATMAGMLDLPEDHVLLAACRDEEAAEAGVGGRPDLGGVASVFTYHLVKAILATREGASLEQIHIDVVNRVADDGYSQRPQVEGKDRGRSLADMLGKRHGG